MQKKKNILQFMIQQTVMKIYGTNSNLLILRPINYLVQYKFNLNLFFKPTFTIYLEYFLLFLLNFKCILTFQEVRV